MKWVLFPNAMNRSSCLQFHVLPCNFSETPVFWNPVPGGEGSTSRMCVDPGCHDPMFWPAELSEWTCVCQNFWFVELAYRSCVSHVRNMDVNSSAVNQREYRTFDVIKSIAFECVRAQPGVHKVSSILGAVMDSWNSKTIEQRRSYSGRKLGDDCECNTGPDHDLN